MAQCEAVRHFLLDHFSINHFNPEARARETSDDLEFSVREHLAQCSSCRLFQSNLAKLGGRLDGWETTITAQIQVPPLHYFESLIVKSNAARPEPNAISPAGARTCFKGCTRLYKRQFIQVLAFLGVGIMLLSGIVLLLQAGLFIPVGILFGMVSLLLPFMILIDKPGIGNQEVS